MDHAEDIANLINGEGISERRTFQRKVRRTYKLDILSYGVLKPYLTSPIVDTGLIELGPKGAYISRSPDESCSVKDDVVFISDPSISEQHCHIEINEDKLLIRDLGSENGLYIYNQVGELQRCEVIRVGEKEDFFIGHIPFFFYLRRAPGKHSANVKPVAPTPHTAPMAEKTGTDSPGYFQKILKSLKFSSK